MSALCQKQTLGERRLCRAPIVIFTPNGLVRENSNLAHENQDQQNYDDEAQAAAAVIAGTVEWRAANAADATEKDQNQND